MSFLYPLYALAALAVAAPLLFHLVRRKPKEKLDFSSTLFLDSAPPKLNKRSQIDQWFLLLLRVAAILLVAFAFSRPYWDVPVASDSARSGVRRMILVDNSASMQRDDLLEKAKTLSKDWVSKSDPNDVVSVYAFAESLIPYFSMSDSLQALPNQRQKLAKDALNQIPTTWFSTNLGRSLADAVDLLQRDDNLDTESAASTLELIVVSDFQQGSRTEELSTIQWPQGCNVRLVPIGPSESARGNATLRAMKAESDEPIDNDLLQQLAQRSIQSGTRVRVTNSAQSKTESLTLVWVDRLGRERSDTNTTVVIPAGQSRVVRMPSQPEGTVAIRLSGDREIFDNEHFVSANIVQTFGFWSLERPRTDETKSASFFLKQLPLGDPERVIQFEQKQELLETAIDPKNVPAVAAIGSVPAQSIDKLREFLEAGGRVLWVLNQELPNMETTWNDMAQSLFGSPLGDVSEAKVSDYNLLEDIDFSSSLFRDFSDSKFSDFTKVRIWRHRCLTVSEPDAWKVLAKFDDGFPAFLQRNVEKGVLTMMMAGWEPDESQIALSSKFVPLISRYVEESLPVLSNQASYVVGDHFQNENLEKVVKPSGENVSLIAGQDTRVHLDQPGIYETVKTDGTRATFAVNLAASESQTNPLELSQLSQFGMPLEERNPSQPEESMQRQLRAVELESQQSPWRWLMISMLMLIACESIFSAWRSQSRISVPPAKA